MKTILFVCTGNTCRSPMAACLMNALAQSRGREVQALSAGLAPWPGAPASEGAKRSMERRGLSLDGHKAQPVTPQLLHQADLVVGMSQSHLLHLRALDSSAALRAFDDPPITDPYGGDDAVYEQAARDIQRQLPALLDALKGGTL